MGYTHYWTQKKNITALDWQDMQAAFVRILAQAKGEGLRICGPDGTGAPEFGSESLAFNGDESEECSYSYTSIFDGQERRIEQDGAHETFFISRKREKYTAPYDKEWRYTFCKTAEKPYDMAVTAIGCYLETFWPSHFEFSSDGKPDDWRAGLTLACRALPEKGNQLRMPAWVQENGRWERHGISGASHALKKHITGGWVIVDQRKPMLAPAMSIPEESALKAVAAMSGSYRGDEYERKQHKIVASLMRTYAPEMDNESAMVCKLLSSFAATANERIVPAA